MDTRLIVIGSITLLVVVSAATRTLAQPPVPGDQFGELARQAEQDLRSDDPRAVAWGAYHAGVYHLSSTTPFLLRILESPPSVERDVRRELINVVLDALLQLNASVPASLADRYVAEHPVPTLALLANATGRETVLVDRLRTFSGIPWYAVANILLQDKSQGLTVHLLTTLRLRVRITVSDEDRSGLVGGVAGGIAGGDGIGQRPIGFPPHAEYRFETGARPGFIVLAMGPQPVYYSRNVMAQWQYGTSSVEIGGPNDRLRLEYLNEMIAPVSRLNIGLQAETSEEHRWTTAAALRRAVEDLRAATARKYEYLVSELVRFDRLPADIAPTLAPHIAVQLVDERRDRSIPLPVIQQ